MKMNKNILELPRNLPRFSLQQMSLFRIITSLCNNRQLLDLILECNFQKDIAFRLCARKGKEWEAVQTMADELVSQICNCVLFKKKILELLWPVCYRIMLWKSIYASYINNTFLQHFYWTDRGRIDNTRTARSIVGNRNISAGKRFVLACSACLNEEIHETWREMSSQDLEYCFTEDHENISPLLLFWTRALTGSVHVLHHYIEGACKSAVKIGLLEAVKYLLTISNVYLKRNLARSCIEQLITKLSVEKFLEEDENDIGYYVFFEMTELRQKKVFKFYSGLTLSLLLHSSEYELFLNLFQERLRYYITFDPLHFPVLIYMTFYAYHLEIRNDEDCRELFIDVWRKILARFGSCTLLENLWVEFLSVLIRDNFPFLLEKETSQKIEGFSSLDLRTSDYVKEIDFSQGKWELLNFIIEEEMVTIPSLDSSQQRILSILKIRQSHEVAWGNILRFVRRVRNKNTEQKE